VLQFIALSPTLVDVSSSDSLIDFEITVQDDILGLAQAFVYAKTDYQYPYVNISSFPLADGNPVRLRFSMPISMYIPGGLWPLSIYTKDVAGNYMTIKQKDLAESNYPDDIEVVNSKGNKDTVPPKLLNLVALGPLTVNTTHGPSIVRFQLTMQDDFSGLQSVLLVTGSRGSNTDYTYFESTSGAPILVNYTQDFQNEAPGSYSIEVQLVDRAGNRALYPQQNLTKLGYPSIITVVK
jgi:hypothetical protein